MARIFQNCCFSSSQSLQLATRLALHVGKCQAIVKAVLLFVAFSFGHTAFAQTFSKSEKVLITIHANIDPSTTTPTWLSRLKSGAQAIGNNDAYRLLAEAESVSAGHAWISVKQRGACKTYGLFDGGPKIDQEKKYNPGILRSLEISESQLSALHEAIRSRSDYQWTGYYNCASYASELWKEATGETINPVPSKTFYVDSKGGRHEVKQNIRLRPLPPSPLGVIQEIIRLSNGGQVTVSEKTVCP